jgi:hypothetical protein
LIPVNLSAALAWSTFADQFDAGRAERAGELHQRIDVTADDAVACFHALDGRDRQAGRLGQLALVDAEKGPGGAIAVQ